MVVWETEGQDANVQVEKAFCTHYCETAKEFFALLKHPLVFYHADCKHLMLGQKADGSKDLDWVKDFEVWSAITFHCYLVMQLFGFLGCVIAAPALIGAFFVSMILGIIASFFQCHLLWFIVRWRDGACIPCCPCIDIDKKYGKIVILIIAIFKVIYAVMAIIQAFQLSSVSVIYMLLYLIGALFFAVPNIYVGWACFQIFQWMKQDEVKNFPSKVAHLPDDYQAMKATAPASQPQSSV